MKVKLEGSQNAKKEKYSLIFMLYKNAQWSLKCCRALALSASCALATLGCSLVSLCVIMDLRIVQIFIFIITPARVRRRCLIHGFLVST